MKTNTPQIALILCLATLAMLTSTSEANLTGSDNFNDNSKDLTKWDTDSGFGTPAGVLTEINGRLQFSSSGTADTYQARPWKLNFGSYTSNWEFQMDAVIPADSGMDKGIGFGLEVWSTTSPNLFVGIEHANFGRAPEYDSYRGTTSNVLLDTTFSSNAVTAGAVRISFNATTKVVTTSFDADGPSNGYQWTFSASYGLAGSGGATGNTNWGMTATDTFTAVPFGDSSGVAATAGQASGDNFVATPEPSSTALFVGGMLLLGCRRKPYLCRTCTHVAVRLPKRTPCKFRGPADCRTIHQSPI